MAEERISRRQPVGHLDRHHSRMHVPRRQPIASGRACNSQAIRSWRARKTSTSHLSTAGVCSSRQTPGMLAGLAIQVQTLPCAHTELTALNR